MLEPWQLVARLIVIGTRKLSLSLSLSKKGDTDDSHNRNSDYKDLVPNKVVSREFTKYMKSFGRTYLESTFEERMPASTDMGMYHMDLLKN